MYTEIGFAGVMLVATVVAVVLFFCGVELTHRQLRGIIRESRYLNGDKAMRFTGFW